MINIRGSRQPFTSRQLCIIHATAILVPALLLIAGAEPWWTMGIGGAVMFCTYLFLGYAESKKQEFWLSPLSFFFFWYSVGYGASAIYAAKEAYYTGSLPLVAKQVFSEDLAEGYVISLVGALSLHMGYSWVRSLRTSNVESRTDQHPYFHLWIVFFVLGILAILMPKYFEGIGTARAILQLAPFGIFLSFCSFRREYFRLDNAIYGFYFFVGNVVLTIVAFYDGSKYMSMMALLPLFSAVLVRPRWRKLIPVFLILGMVAYFFIVAPILMRARQVAGTESQRQKLEIASQENFLTYQEDAFFAFQDEGEKFLYRLFESTAVGFIVSDVRDNGYKFGDTMENLKYAFVPRVIWPSKPTVTRGLWFTVYLGGSPSEEEANSNTAMYSAGELYWNFGWFGVTIGMAIMGSLFGLAASLIGDGPHRLVVPMIVFMCLIVNIVEQGAATQVFILVIYLFLVIGAYRYFQYATATLGSPSSRMPLLARNPANRTIQTR